MSEGNGEQTVSRDSLRTALLRSQDSKSEIITLFDQEVELRQPTLGAILDARSEADTKTAAVAMIIAYACVPGTDDRIFEEGDTPMMLKWPFGDELIAMQRAIAKLSGVDLEDIGDFGGVTAAAEALETDPLADKS